jgi:hypothetical protein
MRAPRRGEGQGMVGIVREQEAKLAATPLPSDEEAPVGELLNILLRF